MSLKNLKISFIFLTAVFVFLFFGSKALAAACNKPPAWNTTGSCTLDIYYEDPSGGSNLAGCYYNIQSGTSPTCPSDGTWSSACNCNGLANTTCPITVSIGSAGNCNVNGAGTCKVCSKAIDAAGNTGNGEQSLNIDFAAPTVSVTGTPASWQNNDATASVSCSDAHSGCDSATYKLKTYTSNPGTCSTNYADYTLASSQTISSHLWVCGAAKDNVGNAGFSSPVEFKIDKEKPSSQITNPSAGSTQTADFNVTVSDTDTGGSGLNTSACYYRTYDSGIGWTRDWTTRTCNASHIITVGSGKDCQTNGGTCTVYVYSYDNAGNQSDINLRSFTIHIGLNPPTITINTPSGLWYNSNPLLDVDFSDDDALDDGFYQVDSYTGTWTAIFTNNTGTSYTTDFKISDSTWNGFADGSSHTIYFKATDDAGNVTGADGSKSLVIKKDVSGPTVTVTGNPANWQNTDATATVSCTDTGSGCDTNSYKLKTYTYSGTCSTTYSDYILSSPQTISSHLWVCGAAKDLAGNAGFSPNRVEFKVDKTEPNSQIQSPASGTWYANDFNLDTLDEDLDSGLDTTQCQYKIIPYEDTNGDGLADTERTSSGWLARTCNAPPNSPVTSITVGPTDYCKYQAKNACYVYIRSKDIVGNWHSPSEDKGSIKYYHIDWTAPVPGKLYITATEGDEIYPINVNEGTEYTFKSHVTDNLKIAACDLYIDNINQGAMALSPSGCSTDCTASKNFTFTGSGTFHNNYSRCRDAAGNIKSGTSVDIAVEANHAPVITSGPSYTTSPCTSPTTQEGCNVNFTVSATDSDNDTLTYSWDFGDGGTSTEQNPVHHYSTANTYIVIVTVSDGRGGTDSKGLTIIVSDPTLSVDLCAGLDASLVCSDSQLFPVQPMMSI